MQKEDNLNEYFTNLTHKSEKICYTTIRNKIFLKLIRKKGCPVDGSIYERAAKLGPVSRAAGMDCECPFYMRRFGGTGNQTGGTYMENNLIIAIGRQFGSGGHEIGEKLAKKLGIKFYDKELIKLIAKESGLCEKVLESYDEKPTNSLLYSIVMDIYPSVMYTGPTIDQQIYQANYDAIRRLAERENCVIVGRCADYILRDHPGLVSVFVHADKDFRAARVAEEYKLPDAKVRDMLVKTDKKRANYYNFQSEKQWGAATSYNLCIESSALGIDNSVELIMEYIKHKRGRLD